MTVTILSIDQETGLVTLAFTDGDQTVNYSFLVDLTADVKAQIRQVAADETGWAETQIANMAANQKIARLVGTVL